MGASSVPEATEPEQLPVGEAMTEPGILHPTVAHARFDYRRHRPDQRLAPYVENFWTITWDLRDQEPYTAQVLPYLSVTNTEADVTGLSRTRYQRFLAGRGYVVGARFRPGCFRPFVGVPVSDLTDTRRPISEVLGRDTEVLERAVASTSDRSEWVSLLTEFLLVEPPGVDPVAHQLAELVERIAGRPEITRVAQVATLACSSERRLQRLFMEYVGAGPKWVIMRCRLQDAASRAAAGTRIDWAGLAEELGFSDQAHLTRAFSRTIGIPPATYAAVLRSGA